jgi:hypothetical protein
MKNTRTDFRRAQFRLWIFSYTILPRSSKKRLSRLMIGFGAIAPDFASAFALRASADSLARNPP